MDKKMPKKISLKDFGMEKIILIAIAGIVLLAANFSEWKNSSSKTSEKQEKSIETSQNDAYVEALENKLVHIKYYGWRMTMFDEYRNAVSVKEISGDITPSHPILSWVFYAFLLVTLFLSVQFVRGWFDSEN